MLVLIIQVPPAGCYFNLNFPAERSGHRRRSLCTPYGRLKFRVPLSFILDFLYFGVIYTWLFPKGSISIPDTPMHSRNQPYRSWLLPSLLLVLTLLIWWLASRLNLVPSSVIPSPAEVAAGFLEELVSGRLWNDIIASLYRVTAGFGLAVLLGLPAGLWMGTRRRAREALLPAVNFFRNLSPLAWIPFAILWFGIGDAPAIFLIFMAAFFPIVLSTVAAVANIPSVYFRVGQDYGMSRGEVMRQITFPAIAPQVITTLRVTAGLSWLVVVAAEMIAGRDGLGFAIWDARNGLRIDLLVSGMIVIGVIGVILDQVLVQLTKIPAVRWGYEQ